MTTGVIRAPIQYIPGTSILNPDWLLWVAANSGAPVTYTGPVFFPPSTSAPAQGGGQNRPDVPISPQQNPVTDVVAWLRSLVQKAQDANNQYDQLKSFAVLGALGLGLIMVMKK